MHAHSFLYVPECLRLLRGRAIVHQLGATLHPMDDKLETSIPLDEGHKKIMLMADDKPPWTEKVQLPRVNPKLCAQDTWDQMQEPVPRQST